MAQPLSEAALLALIDRLADGRWHSGEELARSAGISRAALAKRIAHLADWQLSVEARQGLGYRLAAPIERLDAASLQAAVPALRLRVLTVTDSTSTQALAAPAGDDPQAFLAEYQTGGRGRRGRHWLSPFGAQLALSLAWSFDEMPPQLGALPLAVGICCAQVLREHGLDAVGVKWPNDLQAGGRKLGGILLEHRGEAGGGCRIVAGVGINLRLPVEPAGAIDQPWTDLAEACASAGCAPPGRNVLAASLLQRLHALFRGYGASGFAPWAASWDALDVMRGRIVRVLQGQTGFEGRACGVDADGALIVDTAGQVHRLHSGDVSVRP